MASPTKKNLNHVYEDTLHAWLSESEYSLAFAPAFFGFFGYVGALKALKEAGLLKNIKYLAGASAGAMAAGMLAAGMDPEKMESVIVGLERDSFWDPPALGGFLKGKKFQDLISKNLPVQSFEECKTSVAVTAFNLLRFSTEVLDRGSMADAIVASATFPGMFAPVFRQGCLLIDGGVRDTCGLMGVKMVGGKKGDPAKILNIGINNSSPMGPQDIGHSVLRGDGSVANKDLQIASLFFSELPKPGPFALEEGPKAIEAVQKLVKDALSQPLKKYHKSSGHWIIQRKGSNLPAVVGSKKRNHAESDQECKRIKCGGNEYKPCDALSVER